MEVTVIGKGKFGTAVGSLLEHNSVDFTYTTGSESLNRKVDVAFIAVPTQAIREALTSNRPYMNEDTVLVNCSKGIEEKTHLLPHQIVKSLDVSPKYSALMGPSFADEIINNDPTIVSLGYTDKESAHTVEELLTTPYFSIRKTMGYKALELAGAMKNVYAILCGYARGVGFGMNTNVHIILNAKTEFEELANALKYQTSSIDTPGVIGDMILTCTSEQSRNFSYGYNLAQKHDTDPHETQDRTVEGYHTCRSISEVAKECKASMPLARLATRIVEGDFVTRDEFREVLVKATSKSS